MNKKILTPMRSYSSRRVFYVYHEYLDMFKVANLDVIVASPCSDETLDFLVKNCDGLLLTGGFDVDPELFNQPLNPLTNKELSELEALEINLINKFAAQNKPILGICRGIQTINVAFGGSLIQDILETNKYNNHLQDSLEGYHHLVKTTDKTMLQQFLGKEFMTNSFHHQAIERLADGFIVSATSEDGIIEAIERDNIIGVQWHPERNNDSPQQGLIALYKQLLKQSK